MRIERSLVGKRFFMIELAHQSLNSRFGIGAHIFLHLFQNLIGTILLVVVRSVVTSSIPRICRLSLSKILTELSRLKDLIGTLSQIWEPPVHFETHYVCTAQI